GARNLASLRCPATTRCHPPDTHRSPKEGTTLLKKKKSTAWLSLLLAFGLVAAARGDDDHPGASDGTESTDGATDGGEGESLSGTIVVSGSSTVEPISIRVSEQFNALHPDVDITVDGPGTGDGFQLF